MLPRGQPKKIMDNRETLLPRHARALGDEEGVICGGGIVHGSSSA
jgi:hypothetical protein